MRIVITGATGFIGRYLTKRLLDAGEEVFVVVRPGSAGAGLLPESERLHRVEADLDHIEAAVLAVGRADGFLHLAWGGVNRREIDSPEVQARNIAGSLACVRAAAALGCSVFMDAGSRVEYGVTEERMQEDLPCHPINQYGRAKWEFYQKAKPLCERLGLTYYHLRFFSVYGYGDHPWSIISTLVRELPRGETVSLSACLHQWNFMYIEDAADAVYRLLARAEAERAAGEPARTWIVNVASRDTRQLRSFVEEIQELAGGRGRLEYGSFVQAKEGALSIRPDISRLERLTGGFREKYSFAQGIRETMRRELAAEHKRTENEPTERESKQS